MVFTFEVVPLHLHGHIGFQFGIALCILHSVLLEDRDHIIEDEGVHTFVLILRQYADQVEIDHTRSAFESFKQMDESERPETSFHFLECSAEIGHGDGEGDHFVVFLADDHRNEVDRY